MIWKRQWDDPPTFRAALQTEILRRAASTPSWPSHNVGGWRSDETLLDWPLDEIRGLRTRIEQAIAEIDLLQRVAFRAWAVVNRAGSYHCRHAHGQSTWSGIYYIDSGSDSACTVFETAAGEIRVEPVPSLMVIFPSTTWHSVETHRGLRPRITIAFDAR